MTGRSQAYWEKDRTKPIAYEFPYQKTVKASVSGGGQTIATDLSKFEQFYDTDRHLPKSATLTSIDISTEGAYASVKKATVNFTIHDIRNIGSYEVGLLRPGTDVTINYGWSGDRKSQGGGVFKGTTFNFSFSMNDYGGADCVLECLGEGSNFKWLSMNQNISTGGAPGSDEKSENIPVNTILAVIRNYINKNRVQELSAKGMVLDGIGFFEISGGVESEEEEVEDSDSFSVPGWYVTLDKLISLVNEHIISNKLDNKINTSPKAVYGFVPSGDYLKFAFPGFDHGVYNDKVIFTPMDLDLRGGGMANLGNVLINIDYLYSVFTRDISKAANIDTTLTSLFDTLFKDLSEVSGGSYNLTFIIKLLSNGKTAPQITDVSQIKKDKPETYTFTPFVEGSTVRQMTLETQIPELLAQEMYLVARRKITSSNKLVNFMVNGPTSGGISQQQTAQTNIYGSQVAPTDQFLIKEEKENIFTTIRELKKVLAEHNGEQQIARQLIAANRQYVKSDPSSTLNDSVYPLNLSVTIDGLEGIEFGDYITSGWLPRKYQKGLNFMVTKVSHKITVNDWTTDIETQCRF